jgi:hypothetical protein
MLLAATTVVRHVPADVSSGRLLVLDVGHERVTLAAEMRLSENPYRARDLNPRGGTRGLRAVAALDDQLVVADATRVLTLDSSGAVSSELSHPWLGLIHAVLPDPDGVWVVSTSADAVVRLTWSGDAVGVVRPIDLPEVAEALGLPPAEPLGPGRFDDPHVLRDRPHGLTHLNCAALTPAAMIVGMGRALTRDPQGQESLEAYRRGNWTTPAGSWRARHALVRVPFADRSGDPPAVLWQQPVATMPGHDVWLDGPRIWTIDSGGRSLVAIEDSHEVRRIPVEGSFPRGWANLGAGRALVGTQHPLAVHIIDLTTGATVGSQVLTTDQDESITCLTRCPERW